MHGDIFDFKWSVYNSFEETAEQASCWLKDLSEKVPELIYILGNHDRVAEFYPYLDTLSESISHFTWHPALYERGDSLFFHGDLPGYDQQIEERQPLKLHRQKGASANLMYDLIVRSPLVNVTRLLHRPRENCRRIHCCVHPRPDIRKSSIFS